MIPSGYRKLRVDFFTFFNYTSYTRVHYQDEQPKGWFMRFLAVLMVIFEFVFAPYAVGSYAQGAFFVTLPYNALTNLLKPAFLP